MSFNFGLATEIYGNAWMVDHVSFMSLSSILKNAQSGVTLELPDTKYNTPEVYDFKNETKLIFSDYQLDNKNEFEGIGVINLNGVITLSGGASSVGMEQLSEMMFLMNEDERVKGFVIVANSGGGSSSAVQIMSDTINAIKESKPVYGLVKKGGMAASACYGILSACTSVYSEDKMNIVGSAGTMIQFEGREANTGKENFLGEKTIRLYATKSVMKNKAFEDAVNNDDYKLLINELLDPINENFLEMIASNRPLLKGTNYDDGRTVFSKDAIGTFIDGIASFNDVVDMVLSDAKITTSINNNLNTKKMTREEFKNAHPAVYSEIVSEGVTAERERVASWMVYASADMDTVSAGIESGKDISPSQREKLMVKMSASGMLDALKSDNAPALTAAESGTQLDAATAAEQEEKNAFNFELKV